MENEDQLHSVSLRKWCLCKDEESFRQLVKRGDHRLTDGFLPECYTNGCEYRWIQGMVDSLLWGDELHYAVVVDGKVAGCLNVSRCSGVYSHTGILRLILLPEYCGQGIGTKAVVYHPNRASVRVVEKNGFTLEATLHNAVRKGDSIYYNALVYGLLREDTGILTTN